MPDASQTASAGVDSRSAPSPSLQSESCSTLPDVLPLLVLGLACIAGAMFTGYTATQLGVSDVASFDRGAATALYFGIYYGGGALGAYLPGLAWQEWGWGGVAATGIGALAVAAVALGLARPLQPEPLAALPTAVPRSCGGRSVHDQDVAVGVVCDGRAHAATEQPLEDVELPRADDDHVGPAIARQLDDRVRGLADRRHVLRFDAEALEHRCGRVQLVGVHLGESVGSSGPCRAPDRDVTGATLVTTSLPPNAPASSAARCRARFAGSVSSYPTTIVFIARLLSRDVAGSQPCLPPEGKGETPRVGAAFPRPAGRLRCRP